MSHCAADLSVGGTKGVLVGGTKVSSTQNVHHFSGHHTGAHIPMKTCSLVVCAR